MGEVYRARDSRLGREVAVKVLPAELADSADRLRRFEQEARAASALNHPNILTVHDVGTHEGKPYLVTELLEGLSLRERLSQDEKLPLKKTLDWSVQIARGLAAAHAKGIVHRDLKPENLFVGSGGQVKILDFGLAKFTMPAGGELHDATTLFEKTESGTILGTVGYMSPEQVRGADADARSDLFSFGCVLYELLTGRRAFRRETHAETMTAILREEPEPLASLAPAALPPGLVQLLEHCLEKVPERRFQSARDLAFQLEVLAQTTTSVPATAVVSATTPPLGKPVRLGRRVLFAVGAALGLLAFGFAFWSAIRQSSAPDAGPEAAARTIDSLAVLPFRNLSRSPEQEYLSDGLSEELINVLGRLPGLRVAGRTSSFSFKGKEVELAEVGAKLKVESVLEGSVQAEGNRLRVRAQLVSCADGFQLWSESYDRESKDIFAVQEEIARAIADRLRERLGAAAAAAATEVAKTDPETYSLYLKAVQLLSAGREEDVRQVRPLLEEATRRDPVFAPAWARLADAYSVLADYEAEEKESLRAQAAAAARRAASLAPGLAEAHVALAHVDFREGDLVGMERNARRALALNPSDSRSHRWHGISLIQGGRLAEGLAELAAAVRIDPVDPTAREAFGTHLVLARRYEEASSEFHEAKRLRATEVPQTADWWLVWAYSFVGRSDEAVALAESVVERSLRSPVDQVTFKFTLAWAYARAGRKEEARTLRAEFESGRRGLQDDWDRAVLAAALGETDVALAHLTSWANDPLALPIDLEWPALDPVRSEPRFQEIYAGLKRRLEEKLAAAAP